MNIVDCLLIKVMTYQDYILDQIKKLKKTALFNWISDCEREGRAMTQQSGADATMQRMSLILMHQECLTTAHKE